MSRRESLQWLGVGATTVAAGNLTSCQPQTEQPKSASAPVEPHESPQVIAERERRMKWWHAAKFGMFIHWGLYSVYGHHEWAMEEEGIPVAEYEQLAKQFKPQPRAARAWAKLARQAGQKYMVMTTKHHEGFCNFDTKLTNYCAPKQGPGRDLVAEYVEAARAEGRRVGFYYSLMDWHHPDGARCATDEAARQRFVEYTHGLVRELMTNYGKIDILWYDVDWPLDAKGWESEKMNGMVFKLQPDIIVNNRNGLPGDFSTPEQEIRATKAGRAWESCMTMNDSWGYQRADDNWKSAKTLVRNVVECAQGGGNYLLNIGPKGDGSIPVESVQRLTEVGRWMDKHGTTIYETERSQVDNSVMAGFTRKGNTLYVQVYNWPGSTVAVGGLRTKVSSAKLFTTGRKVDVKQEDLRVQFTGLPEKAPEEPVTTIEVESDGEPAQDTESVRKERPRRGVGI
ncbi:MAG: alpha-L-fucosidase [Acidobacteria bacterium]|nr:MAG: alpha-L-fucosidase [Acidobacteriota bacterium]